MGYTIIDTEKTYIERGNTMGDKGGKKDKSKMQKQETGKQQKKDKVKHDKHAFRLGHRRPIPRHR
jgi:hypothetical protein